MALTIAEKPKTAEVKKTKAALDPVAVKVNRITEIEKQAAKLAPLLKEQSALLAELRAAAESKPGEHPVVFAGTNGGKVSFSEKGKITEVAPMKKVRQVMGDKTFFDVASVTIGDIKKYTTAEEQAKLLTEKPYEGSRRVTVVLDA